MASMKQYHGEAGTADESENLYKVLIIGDINTGKTSLVKQYVHGLFPDNYKATIGVDFALKVVHLEDEAGTPQQVKLQLWDIAGACRAAGSCHVALAAVFAYW